MPIYEYRCSRCGEVTEALQKIDDPPLRRCPKCSGRLEKLISRTSFQLKGGGWFGDGYGGKDSKSTEAKSTDTPSEKPAEDSAAKSATGEKGEKSDSKGATKKKAKKNGSSGGRAAGGSG